MPNNNRNKNLSLIQHRRSYWQESLIAVMQPSTDNQIPTKISVGQRLRELRTLRGLSVRSLAEISGLNFNTLSLMENEKTSPNVSTLQQIAAALHIPITTFFEITFTDKDAVHQKFEDRPKVNLSQGTLEDLGAGMALGEGTPLLLTMKPETSSGPDAIVHTGQEFVYCLEGSIAYWVGDNEYILEKDDSLIFQAHIPHRWENRGSTPSRSILIICPSDKSDRSVEQHLKNIQEVND